MKPAYRWDPKHEPVLNGNSISETKSLVGIPLRREPFNTEASRIAVVSFARNVGDRNPLWLEEEYGRGTRWGSMVAPPTWLYSVDDTVVAPGLRGIHSLEAGADWEFYKPVRLGDSIKAEARLVDAVEKTGRFCGRMVLQTGEVVYRNQRGETVAMVRSRTMRCPRVAARERAKYLSIKKYKYTAGEARAIEDGYDAEKIRGPQVRCWEDVSVGEDLTPVVKGPLTAEDMLLFVNVTKPVIPYGLAYKNRMRHPADFYYNPETGLPDFSMACLIDDVMARQCGFPYAHDRGIQRISWLAHLMTNWIGDDGWLESLSADILLPNVYGDTNWCKGKVIGKQKEGSKHLVKCQIWAENQRGERTASGKATVSLLSRNPDSRTAALSGAAPVKEVGS